MRFQILLLLILLIASSSAYQFRRQMNMAQIREEPATETNTPEDAADVEGDAADVEGDAADVEGDAAEVEGDAAEVEGDAAEVEGENDQSTGPDPVEHQHAGSNAEVGSGGLSPEQQKIQDEILQWSSVVKVAADSVVHIEAFDEMISQQFVIYDADNSGEIDKQEAVGVLEAAAQYFGLPPPDGETMDSIFDEVDEDDNGGISFEEFSVNARRLVVELAAMAGYHIGQLQNELQRSIHEQYRNEGPHGQGPEGQGPHGQGPHGQGPHGQGPHGQGPHGQGPSGQGPSGQGPSGQGPSGQGPSGQGASGQGPQGRQGASEQGAQGQGNGESQEQVEQSN